MSKVSKDIAKANDLNTDIVANTCCSISPLFDLPKVQTDEDLEQRIVYYFSLCRQGQIKPGIQSFCLACGITRETLSQWAKGNHSSPRRKELAQRVKTAIATYYEQSMLDRQISDIAGIFLLKATCGYIDRPKEEEPVILEEVTLVNKETLLPSQKRNLFED